MATNPKEKEDGYGYLPGESVGARMARRAKDAIGFVSQAVRAGDDATARAASGPTTGAAASLSDPLIQQPAPQQPAAKPPAATPATRVVQKPAAMAPAVSPASAPVAAQPSGTAPDGSPLVNDQITSADRMAMDAKAHADEMASIKLRQQIQDGGAPAEGFTPAAIRHSGNDWQARNDLRNLQVSASSMTEKDNPNSPAMLAYKAGMATDQALKQGNDPALIAANHDGAFMDRTQAAERAASARFGMSNKIAQQRADAEQQKLGFDTKAAAQIQTLQQQIIAEKDPAKLAALQDKMQTLTGKYQRPDAGNKFTVVPGGQAVDQKTGQPYTVPARVLDNQTGKFVDQPAATQEKPQYEIDKIYQDAKGNQAKWDGTKFVSVK